MPCIIYIWCIYIWCVNVYIYGVYIWCIYIYIYIIRRFPKSWGYPKSSKSLEHE